VWVCGYGLFRVSWAIGVERKGVAMQGRETSSSPASVCPGKKKTPGAVQNGTILAFFLFFLMNNT